MLRGLAATGALTHVARIKKHIRSRNPRSRWWGAVPKKPLWGPPYRLEDSRSRTPTCARPRIEVPSPTPPPRYRAVNPGCGGVIRHPSAASYESRTAGPRIHRISKGTWPNPEALPLLRHRAQWIGCHHARRSGRKVSSFSPPAGTALGNNLAGPPPRGGAGTDLTRYTHRRRRLSRPH